MTEDDKLLVLLSDGLKEILKNLSEKYKCEIANDLLRADNYIAAYNELVRRCMYTTLDYDVTLNLIREEISKLINDEARMLSYRYNTFEISYLPKDKEPVYSDETHWSRENRVCAKPARIIQKLMVHKYSCKDYENFSNWFKSEVIESGDFVIVEGEDIPRYYLEDNYYKDSGTLGNSCMRYRKCQKYFDVYKDHAKMLVCLKDGLVLGRAIVWEINGNTYMDRIYTCMDYLEHQFITYAEAHNWRYRINNDLLCDEEEQHWLVPDDGYKTSHFFDLEIDLDKDYDYMPYLDSFRYLYLHKDGSGYLSTTYDEDDSTITFLSSTDGAINSEYEVYQCGHCGRRIRSTEYPDDWVYSEYLDMDLCEDCSTYCNGIDDYVSIDTPVVNVYVDIDDTQLYPEDFCKDNDDEFVLINNEWYDIKTHPAVIYNEFLEVYELKDE